MTDDQARNEVGTHVQDAEERLRRLLGSGLRQSRAELAALRDDADLLRDAGLVELAARLAAVADASTTEEILPTISVALSACRLVRARLSPTDAPEAWRRVEPPKQRSRSDGDRMVPVARQVVGGKEYWICVPVGRTRWILVEPPFELEEPKPAEPAPTGFLARLRRHLDGRLQAEQGLAGPWLRRTLRGTLRWRATLPIRTGEHVAACALDDAELLPEDAYDHGPRLNSYYLPKGRLVTRAPIYDGRSDVRTHELNRSEAHTYLWLDPSAQEAFGRAPTERVWALMGAVGDVQVVLARLDPLGEGHAPRLVHLLPHQPL